MSSCRQSNPDLILVVYLLKLHQENREARVDAREFGFESMVVPFGVVAGAGAVVVEMVEQI